MFNLTFYLIDQRGRITEITVLYLQSYQSAIALKEARIDEYSAEGYGVKWKIEAA